MVSVPYIDLTAYTRALAPIPNYQRAVLYVSLHYRVDGQPAKG